MLTSAYAGDRPIGPARSQRRIDRDTLDDRSTSSEKSGVQWQPFYGGIGYLVHKVTPNLNYYPASIINNVGMQWRLSNRPHNVNRPNDQTKIGNFRTEFQMGRGLLLYICY